MFKFLSILIKCGKTNIKIHLPSHTTMYISMVVIKKLHFHDHSSLMAYMLTRIYFCTNHFYGTVFYKQKMRRIVS